MEEMPLADDLRHTTYRLARRLTSAAQPEELPPRHRLVLAALDTEDGLTSADIARREHITPQAVSLAVGALLTEGLIEQRTHPGDRRRRTLTLTAKGREIITGIRQQKNTWVHERLNSLSAAQRETLRSALEIMRQIAETPGGSVRTEMPEIKENP